MNSQYGSEWRKWDFHVHTPYSILNNQYGVDPFDSSDDFDKYVIELFTRAVDKGIAAIGITDYFMIDGYKRIRTEYLDNPEKMKECFPDDELRRKVEQIFIFPNIEFRIPTFVAGKKSVNYHVLFSDQVPLNEIEENFLHLLPITPEFDKKRALTRTNIEAIGKMVKEDNGNSGSDLIVGLEQITVSDDKIQELLTSNSVFSGKYLIVVPVDEHLPKVQWKGRDYLSRKALHRQAHCYMTSNEKSREIALAVGHEEEYIREFGSIKPCIWGSDAHEYARMFEPDQQRYCWIKADPTFDGLLQILYEPADRVHIQKDRPDSKDPHQVIDFITFDDERFQTAPIYFNDNLTCIIGGKSTGKSILLRQLAATIDSEHVNNREKRSGGRGKFVYPKATVQWKDGTTTSRKIVYIPQTFLNRTVDHNEQTTEITGIIEGVLKQNPTVATASVNLLATLRQIADHSKSDISLYCTAIADLKKLQQTILREGRVSTFQATIEKLEAERKALAEKVDVSPDEITRYTELEKEIQRLQAVKNSIKTELQNIGKLRNPTVVIPGHFEVTNHSGIQHAFGSGFERCGEQILRVIEEMSQKIQPDWNKQIEVCTEQLHKEVTTTVIALADAQREYDSLKEKVERSEQLQTLAIQISNESARLDEAVARECEEARLSNRISELKARIVAVPEAYRNAYSAYCDIARTAGALGETNLKFDAQVVWKKSTFIRILENIFDNRNFSSFRSAKGYDLQNLEEGDYTTDFLNDLWASINNQGWGGLTLKAAFNIETALNQIFQDCYNIHYIVSSGSDTIEEMSPGKKALVLLELLINLENSKCPILIDQPEDDLDNRSIYGDLVKFIRQKKMERQIIVVTHNANIVLGADTEEVIVANQEGQDTPNAQYRFEYRSGAIENDSPVTDSTGNLVLGILNKAGIQTQICDILEGGKTAFELRQHKYTAMPN